MKIHYLSDLHLEFGKMPKNYRVPAGTDVVVLAGDIGVGLAGLHWALLAFDCPVVYVAGNHEHYGHRTMEKLLDKARAKVAGTHVHFLENDAIEIEDVRFIGTTMWTNFRVLEHIKQELAMNFVWKRMTDYFEITLDRRPAEGGMHPGKHGWQVTPRKILELHCDALDFLGGEIAKRQPNQSMVIVTHHAPSERSLRYGTATEVIDTAYVSRLDALVETSGAALWIHGHGCRND
jgi:Icc-related predicted phosphoesterase